MSSKNKVLCDFKKDKIMENFELFKSIVLHPEFACRKCGRVASEKKRLCKPIALKDGAKD